MAWSFNLIDFNPFAKFFQKNKPKIEQAIEIQKNTNAQGLTQEEIDSAKFSNDLSNIENIIIADIDFDSVFTNKRDRIAKYREMSMYPEVSDGIENVNDDAVVEDDKGNILDLDIDEEHVKLPKAVEKKIRDIFHYLINDVYNFSEFGWKYFNDWLIESELYLELIMNNKKNNIIGVKKLPAFTMIPIYKGTKIVAYKQIIKKSTGINYSGQNKDDKGKDFAENQIAYINYGLYGKNRIDTRGYLEAAIRPYNQLVSLEDSLVVYRLVRAPQRKVWNIDVGKMPKGKAREFIKQQIQTYKKKAIYDPTTGKVNSTQNIQSMSEDYWFAKTADGKGTSVETIGGDMDIGPLNDLDYFLKKLYKVLKLPKSRWGDEKESMFYHSGRMGEITREEVKFSNFINRLQNRFKYLILNPFLTLMKMRGIDEKYLNEKFYKINFTKSNLFAEHRKLEMLESRFRILGDAVNYIVTPENVTQGDALFSKEFVMKNYFNIDDEDYDKNKELIDQEILELEKKEEEKLASEKENDTEDKEDKEDKEENDKEDDINDKELEDKDDSDDKAEEKKEESVNYKNEKIIKYINN